jgi:glycosyltransferase involved in cell wall biosynthesis
MKWVCRRSLFTIVTNDKHKQIVEGWGARVEIVGTMIVPDGNAGRNKITHSQSIVVIGTFAEDEPYYEIVRAASLCPTVFFYVTGDYSKATEEVKELKPANVIFTGFLNREDYISLVKSVDAAMILVTSDNTMQRGAYEAMSWGTPIITSAWPILKNTFTKGALFVSNDAKGIAIAVREYFTKKEGLKLEIQDLRKEKEQEWKTRVREIKQQLDVKEGVSK